MTLHTSGLKSKYRSFTMFITLVSSLTVTIRAASAEKVYPLQVLPVDHTIRTNPTTGVKLTFLTTNTPSSGIYFHERSWLANSSLVIFRGHAGLMGYLTETGELIVLKTPTGNLGAATAAARSHSIFCMRGNDVLELALTIDLSSDPALTPSTVTATERRIVTLPTKGQLNVNFDDTYLSVSLDGDPPSIHVIDIDKGQNHEVCKIKPPLKRHGHLQWSRTASNLLSVAGGDDWFRKGSHDRIWVVDPTEGVLRSVYHQIEGELVTHESWWVDDQILFCGAAPAVGFENDPAKREWSHVKALDPKTGTVRILGAGSWWPEGTDATIWKRNWWHCAGSADGRWIVADTFHGDIVLFEGTTTRPHLLTSGHRTFGGGTHPHPGWDRKGRQVIFSSHRLGDKKQAHACIATIPEKWQNANPAPRRRLP
ncbi:MAG: hypothetical protein ABGX16_14780 [Pirellulales bacterium]